TGTVGLGRWPGGNAAPLTSTSERDFGMPASIARSCPSTLGRNCHISMSVRTAPGWSNGKNASALTPNQRSDLTWNGRVRSDSRNGLIPRILDRLARSHAFVAEGPVADPSADGRDPRADRADLGH